LREKLPRARRIGWSRRASAWPFRPTANTYGYLSEHHSFGETEDQAGEYARSLAAEMLATTLDVEFDPDTSWTRKRRFTASPTESSEPAT